MSSQRPGLGQQFPEQTQVVLPPCVQASYIGRHDEHCCVDSRLGFSTGSSRAALSLLVVGILHGRSEALLALARSREPGLPIYLLGHSAGGVVACTYALEHQEELAGLICESFAFQVPAPEFAISILEALSHLAPHAHVLRL